MIEWLGCVLRDGVGVGKGGIGANGIFGLQGGYAVY